MKNPANTADIARRKTAQPVANAQENLHPHQDAAPAPRMNVRQAHKPFASPAKLTVYSTVSAIAGIGLSALTPRLQAAGVPLAVIGAAHALVFVSSSISLALSLMSLMELVRPQPQ